MVSLISDQEYFTERVEEKNNKQIQTWVSSKRKKGEVCDTFLAFCASVGYRESVFGPNSHTPTRNADSSSHVGQPSLWSTGPCNYLLSSLDFCWLLSPADCPCSIDCSVLSTALVSLALGPYLPSSSSGLVDNLARTPFAWFSRQNRQRDPLTGTHWYPHPHKLMPSIVSQIRIVPLLR